MLRYLFIFSILLTTVGVALSLAHALELPGKLRLDEATYRKVQTIYYPGFTIGGVSEPVAILATLLLLLFAPGDRFWLIVVALALLVVGHAVYWLVTHRVNKAWIADQPMTGAGASFFGVGGKAHRGSWTELRNLWELSHVARAALQFAGLILLLLAAIPSRAPMPA
jgi:hypothetical protein